MIEIAVAVIVTLGSVAVAFVARGQRRTSKAIGDPNGHGSLTHMLAEVLHLSNRIADETAQNTKAIGHLQEDTAALRGDHAELRGLVIGDAPTSKRTPNGLH